VSRTAVTVPTIPVVNRNPATIPTEVFRIRFHTHITQQVNRYNKHALFNSRIIDTEHVYDRREGKRVVTSVKLLRPNFHVGIVKMSVDKAESGLVHSSVGAGQDASPTAVKPGGKKTATDLVLTGPVELGYVQARRAIVSSTESWKSMLSVPDLAASTAVRQAWSITHGFPPPPFLLPPLFIS
jgi:hypothetical protein